MANIEVLNKVEPIVDESPVINVSMANAIYRGPQGPVGPQGPQGERGEKGEDGSVVFEELTEEQLELLRGPEGPKGDTGNSGVYVGETEPTDADVNVWVIPSGTGNSYTTVQDVQRMINDAIGVIESGSY